jgi:nucleotide-binding universal stress UspA family protein
MTEAHVTWLGILLAAAFLTAMGFLFSWMFRVPPLVPLSVVTARRSIAGIHRILVPVVETVVAERAVELACRLGEDQKAEIILASIVEVPMTLSLSTPMPALEAEAKEALDMAAFIVQQHNLPVRSRVMPQRSAAEGILRIANEEQVDAIILGLGEKHGRLPTEQFGRTVAEVLRKATCEVIVAKAHIPV